MIQISTDSRYCNYPTFCPCLKSQGKDDWCGLFGDDGNNLNVIEGPGNCLLLLRCKECKQKQPQIAIRGIL